MRNEVGRSIVAMAASAAILGLAACDGGASAVASRDHSATTDVSMTSLPASTAISRVIVRASQSAMRSISSAACAV